MSRTDGRKLVALAGTAIVGALGVGTIYLPFIADRDRLRGLFEEGEESIPEGARREIQAIMKAEAESQKRMEEVVHQQQQLQQQNQEEENRQHQKQRTSPSMWSSFRRKQ
jgi:hypothetical protein